MKPPLCSYDLHRQEWTDTHDRYRWDAVAMIRPCGHASHFYVDFDERLKRFNADLNLGFDLKMGRWCIYRWAPEPERLDSELSVGYVHRYLDIIMDMKWAVERRRKDGSKFITYHFREPGDWVFRHLKAFKQGQLRGYNSWVGEELRTIAREAEEGTQKQIATMTKDWADDVMSWADRGNPGQLRQSIVVPKMKKQKALAK